MPRDSTFDPRRERKRAVWWSAVFVFLFFSTMWFAERLHQRDLPFPGWLVVSFWSLVAVALVGLFVLWIFAAKEAIDGPSDPGFGTAKPRGDRCAKCGYSLAGLLEVQACPECGTPLPYAQLVEQGRDGKPTT